MKKTIIGLLIASCILFNISSHAQNSIDEVLNFSQTLDLAISYDQDLQAAEQFYQSTLSTRGISQSALLPQINFSVFGQRTEQEISSSSNLAIPNQNNSFGSTGFNLTLNQTIYNHKLYKQLQQTDNKIASATATVESARQDLIVRLATAYFNVLGAEDNLKFAEAEKQAIEKQLEQSKKRFEVGLIAITDVKETQASFDTSVAQAIDAQNILSSTLEALGVILGSYNTRISPMNDAIDLMPPDPTDIKQWTDKALENNLALKASQFDFQAASDQVQANQAEHYPFLELNAQHQNTDSDGGRFGGSNITDTRLTLQLTVPIYTGGATNSRVKQSVSLKEQARAIKERTRRQTEQQTRDAYLGVTSTIAQVKALKQALLSNQAAHQATQAGFEVGTRTAIDVLSTLREVYRAERDYARARYNYVINTLRLKQAAGSLNINDGQSINYFLQ